MPINTGKIITDLRKQRNWSQTELSDKSGVSREMIGKYERGEAVPSIEAAEKIADAFEVSLDYLVGEGINSKKFDKKTIKRFQELEHLEEEKKRSTTLLIPIYVTLKLVKLTHPKNITTSLLFNDT